MGIRVVPGEAQQMQAAGVPDSVLDEQSPPTAPVNPPPPAPTRPPAAPAMLGGGIADVTSQLAPLVDQFRQLRGPEVERALKENIGMARQFATTPNPPMPAKPALQDIPKKPEFQFRDSLAAFQNPGVVLSIFASLLTRAPLTAAFKAAGAAMQGFQQGDMKLYEKAQQDWKDNLDAALKQNSLEIEKYREALEERSTTITEKMAKMTAIASANRDVLALAQLEHGDLQSALSFINTREAQQQRLQNARDMAQDRDERLAETKRHNLAMEPIAATNAAANAQRAANAGQGGGKLQGTERERAKKDFFALDDKLAKDGDLSPAEWRSYIDLRDQIYGPKTQVAGNDVVQTQRQIPTLNSPTAAPPVQPSPEPAKTPQPVNPNAPRTTTTQLSGGQTQTRTGPPKDPPAAAEGHMIDNAAKIKEAQRALDEIEKYAGAFGYGRYAASFAGDIGQAWYDNHDPKGVAARALVGRLASIELHDLTGAALTLGEAPRFRPFVPTTADSAATTIAKIKELKNHLTGFLQDWYSAYGPTSGYKVQPSIEQALSLSFAPAPDFSKMSLEELTGVDETQLSPADQLKWVDEVTRKQRK